MHLFNYKELMSSMSFVLKFTLLCTLMGGMICGCSLKNYTLWIEDHNCSQCMAINTTICSGYCYTQDTNFRGRIGRTFLIQRSCLPRSVVYRPAHMPSCPHNVDPHLYYPAAQSCSCRRCDTRTHRCIRTRRYSEDQCTVSPKRRKNRNPSFLKT